jgi:hypothetical protein
METLQGKLRAYTDVGCYPLGYLDGQNSTICVNCAQESIEDEVEEFRPVVAFVNWEDPSLYCDQCSARIESAYAENEAI